MSVEKNRPEALKKPAPGDGGGSMFDAVPDQENKNVTISSGPYQEVVPVAGMSVGEVRRKFSDRFDIDGEAASIVDGNPVDEKYVLKANEKLGFIRHAGEKGFAEVKIEIDRDQAIATNPEGKSKRMGLETLINRAGAGRMSTGSCILPSGVKAVLSRGPITIWVWEQAPCIQLLRWRREDSPRPYGPGTTYRNVRIALPYLVIFGVFCTDATGMPRIARTDECFFRNEPLKSLADKLYYPALLNCSKYTNPNENNPLSWICTQYLKETKQMTSANPGDRFCAGFEAVRYCLLETGFNLSSENHEGNSWYGASKGIDPRLHPIAEWEKATKKDPLFPLEVNWIPTNHSVAEVAERIFKRTNAVNTSVRSSNDLYRIIFNG